MLEFFIIDDFSNWYLRRSRRRFQRPESKREGREVTETTAFVLSVLAELLAPFVPYSAEEVYQGLKKRISLKQESVHLRSWPSLSRGLIRKTLLADMDTLRKIAADALRQRAEAGVKVRQPLGELAIVKQAKLKRQKEILRLVQDEVNVKRIIFIQKAAKGKLVVLNTELTEGLRREGTAREIVRNIQELRRELQLKPTQKIRLQFAGPEKLAEIVREWQKQIRADVGAAKFQIGGKRKFRAAREIVVGREKLWVGVDTA